MLSIRDKLTSIHKKQRTIDSMLQAGILSMTDAHFENTAQTVDIDILYQKEATIGVGSVTESGMMEEHTHDNSRHYLICIAGRFIVKFDGMFRAIGPGECVALDAGVPHTTQCLKQGKLVFINVPAENQWSKGG